ncbi:hypothetical protein VFPPC_15740 [Pochonia chlamydosporia 170]|uniref:Uncharacterized protein n=1 Tax=Pochonia chlamydosporia 170 TaxID=1380566 RepID=A0A179FQE6_METCM|nr:hypothetical protein VFPPC_15740 [Pochonia chlamydosporia 170]OAQ67845.1 hypothetical protein VFPPC_15740 [Pochonia chlamydosporia 170]
MSMFSSDEHVSRRRARIFGLLNAFDFAMLPLWSQEGGGVSYNDPLCNSSERREVIVLEASQFS